MLTLTLVPRPPFSHVKASVRALAIFVLHLHLLHVPPPPIPVLLSANYRLRDSQESCLSQSEEREAQPSSPGVPLRKHLRASLVNPPPTTSALHTHTHTQMQHLVLAPHCQHHASPMFPQISINLLCLSKRS